MNIKNLRPKYTIEQYYIVFTFPGAVYNTPAITVSVVNGEDPNADNFAGLPIVFSNTVAVSVVGGIAGCVYQVSCTASVVGELEDLVQAALIAVFPTAVTAPEGAPPAPDLLLQTTPPYPIIFTDSLDVIGTSRGPGFLLVFPIDRLDAILTPLGGTLTEALVYYSGLPENFDVQLTPLGGTLVEALLRYQELPENMDVLLTPTGGTLIVVLLRYQNYPPEGFDVDLTPLGGTLT